MKKSITQSIALPRPAPSIQSVSPTFGPTTGGTLIKIIGANFVLGCTLKIAGTDTPVTFVSSSQLVASTPAKPAGGGVVAGIRVANPDGQIGLLDYCFEYHANPGQTCVDLSGTIYLTDPTRHVIRVRSGTTGVVSTYAGTENAAGLRDGKRLESLFNTPIGIAVNKTANVLYIADTLNQAIRVIDLTTNLVTTLLRLSDAQAAAPVTTFGVRGVGVDPTGFVFISDTINKVLWRYNLGTRVLKVLAGKIGVSGCQDGVGSEATFRFPNSLELASNNLIVNMVDLGCNNIRQVTGDGSVKTLVRMK